MLPGPCMYAHACHREQLGAVRAGLGLANAGGLLRGVLVVLAAEEPVAKVQVVLLQTLKVLLRRCVAYALAKKCLSPAKPGAAGKALAIAFKNMLMST